MDKTDVKSWWVRRPLMDLTVFLAVLAVSVRVIGQVSGSGKAVIASEIILAVTLAHFLIHAFYHRQYRFVTDNRHTNAIPVKKIRRLGLRTLGLFLVGTAALTALIGAFISGWLGALIKAAVVLILNRLFGGLLDLNPFDDSQETVVHSDYGVLEALGDGSQTGSGWERFIDWLQIGLIVIGLIVFAVIIISLIVSAVKQKIGGLTLKQEGDVSELTDDIEEAFSPESKDSRVPFFDRSSTASVRRLYRRQIMRLKRRGQVIPQSSAPREAEDLVGLTGRPDSELVHKLYEKARYSQSGCPDEDLRMMKQAVRG